jgi:membrane-associated protein
MHLDLPQLIRSIGYLGVWAIVFAESGLLIGFFLPGDSLLFTAGFIAHQGYLNIWTLAIGILVCAFLGDNVGYATGYRLGRKLFQRTDSWLFHKKHLIKTQNFYEQHGKSAIILARFMPIVRTFAPIVAGIGAMHYRTFIAFNLIGAIIWSFAITGIGYFFGSLIPADQVDKYLLPIIGAIIIVSLLPSLVHLYREHAASRKD